jgi:hypothetical protein
MRDLLERITAHYPRLAQQCYEATAIWLAAEATRLEEGQSLRRSGDEILPGLAQAVRESGVNLTEMARECGVNPIELRRKLALSRLGELMKPAEVWGLCDRDLESKLHQAAREYSLDTEELLDEALRSSTITPDSGAVFPLKSKVDRIPFLLRCRVCRRLRPQPYRIDFTPDISSAVCLLREPAYACYRCLPMHLADQQVQKITRLTESEIPKPNVRAWSAAFAAIAILVLSGLYVRGSGAARKSTGIPVLPATVAPLHFADELAVGSRAQPASGETRRPNFPATASSSTAAESQVSGIDSGKQHEIAALPVLTPDALRRAETNHTSGGQRSEISLSRGGGGQSQPGEDTNLPETQMPEMAALPLERPTQIDTSERQAVVMANNYVRAVNSGIGIGRGGGIGSGYGQSIGNSFGGFISGLRRSGLDFVIIIDGTDSMKLVIGDVKAKMRELMLSVHRLVPTARIGIVVFGGRAEPIQVQPLTQSTGTLMMFLERIRAQNGGEWQEDTLGAIRTAVDNMAWRSYAKEVIVLVGRTPPFKEDFAPCLQLIRQFRDENGTFNTVDLTVEEHERFIKKWHHYQGTLPISASTLPEFYLETQAAYQAMARAGGGVWRSLTNDEQINQQVLILAFGDKWRSEVAVLGRGIGGKQESPLALNPLRRSDSP